MPVQHRRNAALAAFITIFVAGVCGADTVVHNVRGYTIENGATRTFSYLRFDDAGRVAATGTGKAPAASISIDAGGAVMLPGLIDAHGHVQSFGAAMNEVDLVGTSSLAEALRRIDDFARAHPQRAWITGRGWNQELWDNTVFPSAADIDTIVPDRPVYLRRVDGHAGWANGRALALAGIDSNTKSPPGGMIHRDRSGNATGILVDDAMALVAGKVPGPDPVSLVEDISRGLAALARVGLTQVHDAGISLAEVRAYELLERIDALPVRVYAMLDGIEVVRRYGSPRIGSDGRLVVRSMKLMADGALGSRGAALEDDYSDDPGNRGLLIMEKDRLQQDIVEARKLGYQVNVHAIGDRANRVVLDAFEAAGVTAGERHRNEHAQIISPRDIPRFAGIGIVPSMQPTHATSDKNMAGKRLGHDRLAGAYAWRTFLEQGSRIAAGSDFPVESANPFLGFYAAVTRQDLDGQPLGGWLAEQKMTREETFRAFTLDAAWAAHMENAIGSLERGKWADFILLDADPFKVEARQIAEIGVLETWVGGERVYPRHASRAKPRP